MQVIFPLTSDYYVRNILRFKIKSRSTKVNSTHIFGSGSIWLQSFTSLLNTGYEAQFESNEYLFCQCIPKLQNDEETDKWGLYSQ